MVPEFSQLIADFGGRRFPPRTTHLPLDIFIRTPSFLKALSVERQSPVDKGFLMTEIPSESAAKKSARCVMDLSGGGV